MAGALGPGSLRGPVSLEGSLAFGFSGVNLRKVFEPRNLC